MLVASAAQGVHARRVCGKIAFEIPKKNFRSTWVSLSLFTTCESGAKRCWVRLLSYSSHKTPESNMSDEPEVTTAMEALAAEE